MVHINKNIAKEYLSSKFDFIANRFKYYFNKCENESLNVIYEKNIIIINEDDYSFPLSNLSVKLDVFIYNLEYLINMNFTSEKCYNSLNEKDLLNIFEFYDRYSKDMKDTDPNNIICEIIKCKSNLSNYEYNYNVLKLRSGLYYTKKEI